MSEIGEIALAALSWALNIALIIWLYSGAAMPEWLSFDFNAPKTAATASFED